MQIAVNIFLAIVCVIIPLTWLREFNLDLSKWEDYGELGAYLGGLAAIFGINKGLDEFIKRRKLSQLEKAEKALVVSRRFIDSILYLANPISYQNKEDKTLSDVERAVRERQKRLDTIRKDADDFFRISYEVDLYLDEETLRQFENLEKIWGDISIGFEMYILYLGEGYNGPEMKQARKDSFGTSNREELKMIREFLIKKMRSYRMLTASKWRKL